jgi:hypothetical protein
VYEKVKQTLVAALWFVLLVVLIAIAVPIFCYNRLGEKYAEKKSA